MSLFLTTPLNLFVCHFHKPRHFDSEMLTCKHSEIGGKSQVTDFFSCEDILIILEQSVVEELCSSCV